MCFIQIFSVVSLTSVQVTEIASLVPWEFLWQKAAIERVLSEHGKVLSKVESLEGGTQAGAEANLQICIQVLK